jgi:hypothetical protein
MMIDTSRRQALKLAGAGLVGGMSYILIPWQAHAATKVRQILKGPGMSNFGSGTASGALSFTSGQTVSVTGKYFNSTGGLSVDSCANISITSCDFGPGFGISMNNLTGSINLKNCRFKNPDVNAILLKDSTVHGYVSFNAIRGKNANTKDYIRIQNTGGIGNTDATLLKVEFNHIDGRDPVTNVTTIDNNGGSGIFYGGIDSGLVKYVSIVSNTIFNAAPYGIHVDSGGDVTNPIVLYYNGVYCEKVTSAIAGIYLSKGVGTVGGNVSVSVHDLYSYNAAGVLTPYLDDGTLTTTYLSNVMLAVDLNASG